MLVISYASRELAHRCTKLDVAQEWLSPTNAQALVDLIADAEALESAQALVDFYGVELDGSGVLSVEFSPDWTALLEPAGRGRKQAEGGEIVWEQIRRLMLVAVRES